MSIEWYQLLWKKEMFSPCPLLEITGGVTGGPSKQNPLYFGRNLVLEKTLLFATPTPLDLLGDFC